METSKDLYRELEYFIMKDNESAKAEEFFSGGVPDPAVLVWEGCAAEALSECDYYWS